MEGSATTPIIPPNKYSRNKSGSLQAVQLHRRGWNSTINGLTWRAYLWPASASTTRIANTHCTEDAFRVADHLSRKISRAYRRRKSFFRRISMLISIRRSTPFDCRSQPVDRGPTKRFPRLRTRLGQPIFAIEIVRRIGDNFEVFVSRWMGFRQLLSSLNECTVPRFMNF